MEKILFQRLREDVFVHESTQEGWNHHIGVWMDFPSHMAGGAGWLGWLIMIIFWILVVAGITLLIVWVVRSSEKSSIGREKTALEILNERYARGRIEDEEYEKKKERLEG